MGGVDPEGVDARMRRAGRWTAGTWTLLALLLAVLVVCCGWVAVP